MNSLIVKKEINKKTDEIINELNRFTSIQGIDNAFGNKNKIGRSQLAALLSDVKNSSSVDEIKLYLSYKKAKGNGWDVECNNKSVAEHLIDSIRNMEALADNLKHDIENEQGEALTNEDMRVIKLMVIEKLLGYLFWKGTVMAN